MCLALSVIDGLKHVQLEPDYGRLDNSNLVNKPRMIFMLLTLHRAILDSQAFSLPTLANSLPGPFALWPFAPWPSRSLELSLPGAKWTGNFRPLEELLFPVSP